MNTPFCFIGISTKRKDDIELYLLPWTSELVAGEENSVLSNILTCAYMMPSMVGQAISYFGTSEQKEHFLSPMLKGEKQAAECLTEPRGGSDFFGATTTAVLDGDHFLPNGQKRSKDDDMKNREQFKRYKPVMVQGIDNNQ